MPYENICFDIEGPLAIVTLNRPNRRNALSLELMLELIDCLTHIGGDSSCAPSSWRPQARCFAPAMTWARWWGEISMSTGASSTSARN